MAHPLQPPVLPELHRSRPYWCRLRVDTGRPEEGRQEDCNPDVTQGQERGESSRVREGECGCGERTFVDWHGLC